MLCRSYWHLRVDRKVLGPDHLHLHLTLDSHKPIWRKQVVYLNRDTRKIDLVHPLLITSHHRKCLRRLVVLPRHWVEPRVHDHCPILFDT